MALDIVLELIYNSIETISNQFLWSLFKTLDSEQTFRRNKTKKKDVEKGEFKLGWKDDRKLYDGTCWWEILIMNAEAELDFNVVRQNEKKHTF